MRFSEGYHVYFAIAQMEKRGVAIIHASCRELSCKVLVLIQRLILMAPFARADFEHAIVSVVSCHGPQAKPKVYRSTHAFSGFVCKIISEKLASVAGVTSLVLHWNMAYQKADVQQWNNQSTPGFFPLNANG